MCLDDLLTFVHNPLNNKIFFLLSRKAIRFPLSYYFEFFLFKSFYIQESNARSNLIISEDTIYLCLSTLLYFLCIYCLQPLLFNLF